MLIKQSRPVGHIFWLWVLSTAVQLPAYATASGAVGILPEEGSPAQGRQSAMPGGASLASAPNHGDVTGTGAVNKSTTNVSVQEGAFPSKKEKPIITEPIHNNASRPNKTSFHAGKKRRHARLSLKLSLTLSIPENPVPEAHGPGTAAIAVSPPGRNEQLEALNVRIAELEKTIHDRQQRLDAMASTTIASAATVKSPVVQTLPSGETVKSPVVHTVPSAETAKSPVVQTPRSGETVKGPLVHAPPGAATSQPKPKVARQPVQTDSRGILDDALVLINSRLGLLAGTVALLLLGLLLVGLRKRGVRSGAVAGSGPHSEESAEPAFSSNISQSSADAEKKIKVPTQKLPEASEEPTQSILPPEYEMIEEADIYMRFGHDKLAEEALREAIKINPSNPQAYVALLRIFFSRKDGRAFLTLAKKLETLNDPGSWKEVAEMGRAIEPGNPLYR